MPYLETWCFQWKQPEVIYFLPKCLSAVGHKPTLAGSKLRTPKKGSRCHRKQGNPADNGVKVFTVRARVLGGLVVALEDSHAVVYLQLCKKEREGKIWGHTFPPQQMLERWARAPSRTNARKFPRWKEEVQWISWVFFIIKSERLPLW